jgi:antitoxin ParD1/3/4
MGICVAAMNILRPDAVDVSVDTQVDKPSSSTLNDYGRDSTRRKGGVEQLRKLLLDGANSGPGKLIDCAYFTDLRKLADATWNDCSGR